MNLNTNRITVRDYSSNLADMDFAQLKKAYLLVRALDHQLRMNILRLLAEHRILNVTEIFTHLKTEQSVISQSLAIMRRANIVKAERRGKIICYQIHHEKLNELGKFVQHLMASA